MTNNGNTSFFDNLKNMNYSSDFICTYKLLEDEDADCANLCYQTQVIKINNKNQIS